MSEQDITCKLDTQNLFIKTKCEICGEEIETEVSPFSLNVVDVKHICETCQYKLKFLLVTEFDSLYELIEMLKRGEQGGANDESY